MTVNSFTFVELNIWWARLYYPLVSFFERVTPDIVNLQEAPDCTGNVRPDRLSIQDMCALKLFDEMAVGMGGVRMQCYDVDITATLASLVRTPLRIIARHTMQLTDFRDDMTLRQRDDCLMCSLLHSTVQFPDGTILHVLNTHAPVEIGKRLESALIKSNMCKIAAYIKTLDGPLLLSGDFNHYKESSALQPLYDLGLENLSVRYGVDVARNQMSWKADEAVCHIFINDRIHVDHFEVAQDPVSDHQPLILKASIKS